MNEEIKNTVSPDYTEVAPIYDLIYCSEEDARKLLDKYPNAITSDASDFIHEERFSIEVEDSLKNYLKNVIVTGFSDESLKCQLSIMQSDMQPLMREILDELKAETKQTTD